MLNKTYSLRPHCVSCCYYIYILQDDTPSLQCQDKLTGLRNNYLQDYFTKVHKIEDKFIELESEGILNYDFIKNMSVSAFGLNT